MNRKWSLIVVISLFVILAVGCQSNNEEGAQNTAENTEENVVVNENFNETGFPIVDETITMTIMGAKAPKHGPWENLAFFKEMEKLTNIKLEIETAPEASWDEMKNLAFASGELPDFFYRGEITADDAASYGSQGILLPLEDLIDQYAPNLKKIFEEYPDVKNGSTSADGHIYTLHLVRNDLRNLYNLGRMWLSPDLAEELNITEIPTHTDDFYNMLKELKSLGQIPLSAENMDLLRLPMLAAFGLTQDDNGLEITTDGKARFVPIEENYKEYLSYMNRLYTEKLLDNDIFSHTRQQYVAKGKSGKLGVFGNHNVQNILDVESQEVPELDPLMLSPLTSPVNDKPVWPLGNKVNKSFAFAITNNNPSPEAAIRWVDFLYSLKGTMLGRYGVLLSDEYLNDPKEKFDNYEFLAEIEKETGKEIENQSQYVAHNLTIFGANAFLGEAFDNKTVQTPHTAYYNELIKEQLVSEYAKEAVPPVSFTTEEQKDLSKILTDITMYTKEMEAKFIAGQESLENWDDYVKTIEKMNVEKVVEIYQAAYDRSQ